MKKQRVLALALAAAMATSVFGGMSASAADPDAYEPYEVADVAITAENLEDVLVLEESVSTEDGEYTYTDIESGKYYAFDLVAADQDTYDFDDVVNAVEDGDDNALDVVKAYFEFNGDGTPKTEKDISRDATDTRQMALDDFEAICDEAADIDLDMYYEDDLVDYNAAALLAEIARLGENNRYYGARTSQLLYINTAYNLIFGSLLAPEYTYEDMYNDLLEKVDALVEDDYSADNWIDVQKQISLAEVDADKGTEAGYKDAYDHLMYIFTNISTERPSYSDLRDALADLFEDGLKATELEAAIDAVKGSDTKPSAIKPYSGDEDNGATYLWEDYNGRTATDEWKEFAGYKDKDDADEDVVGAYQEAVRVYALCTKSTTRKFVSQSMVDNALEDLNDALYALDPNYTTPNWVIVKLEEALDKANEVNEDDYRTSSSLWKKFVSAMEKVEELLDQGDVKDTVADKAADDLLKAIDNLKGAKKSVPSETRSDLKAVIKEAKELLKDKTDKSVSQILALEDALEAAEDINTSNTVSEYEAAIADLNAAISGYNQIQGWYQDNGKWYYGMGDTTAKGWLNLNGTWYYLNEDGSMATGWINLDGTYYYLKDSGAMATGWLLYNGTWYYLQSWGGMVANGWYWIGGSCYYFYNWGGMAVNTTIDGYTVNASGAWVR